ncbi:hypothetical protein [Nocardia terpenica]|uniref:Uncharacterized protein n=1 Tax=Nocardia terpenica TaxID=455432 RepID=A0A6G9ZFC6_9NOCA|nr:hypothetical protein [Nocardia terpenica]QIS23693.1 hypothetical protein F6W96_40875 [Nocardia terpenica]
MASEPLAVVDHGTADRLVGYARELVPGSADPADRSSAYDKIRQVESRLADKDPRGYRIAWDQLREDGAYQPVSSPADKAYWNGELLAEIGQGHTLHGKHLDVVAHVGGSDDVVVQVHEETGDPVRYVIVHLTFNRHPEPPPWPVVVEDVTFSGHR